MRKCQTITLPAERNRKYEIEIETYFDDTYFEGGEVDKKLSLALGKMGMFG